jgi:hypothetical protein
MFAPGKHAVLRNGSSRNASTASTRLCLPAKPFANQKAPAPEEPDDGCKPE